jgi:RimJ/RimL family protein N-acetyltransferase
MMLEGILVDLVPYRDRFREIALGWLNSEAEFWAGAGNRPVISKAAHQRRTAYWNEEQARCPSPDVWFGIQTKNGTPIGQVMMVNVLPHHRVAMLGILIGEPDYWGVGYGTDALLLIIDYAFDWLDFRRLWLGTMAINARMSRVAQKIGFRLEACQRGLWYAGGAWCDSLFYGLLREEWPGRAAMIERLGLKEKPHP